MKKNLLLFVFACLLHFLTDSSAFAQTPQPTGITTFYYCINDSANQLNAGGINLLWYQDATGGTGSSTAPIPSTATAGSTNYYVTQTVGGLESSRKAITVNVNKQFELFCAGVTTSSVNFDFSNVGQTRFDYTYTIDGGASISGTQTSPSSFSVNGLSEGQTVVFTVTAVGAPFCVANRTLTASCRTTCSTLTTPIFNPIGPICSVASVVPVLPSSSLEGINGTWLPAVVSNTASGTYVFTPNANECATTQRINIIVNPNSAGFSDFSICSGNSVPDLDTTSPNGVTGTWNPTAIDNLNSDSYTFTPDIGQCAAPQTIDVTVVPSNTLVDFTWTVTEAFAENQKITVAAIAPGGDYLYQLDDGPFQSNPVFEYVASGTHSITVMDQSGCSMPITKNDILVINYPKYFTPNNDGYNDYWNISELSTQPYAYIRIFDRYGKFLKQISPNSTGWNGMYNGHFMPADDYWFVIHYLENNVVKEFKSHFALKR